jgi:hypothetical protein
MGLELIPHIEKSEPPKGGELENFLKKYEYLIQCPASM